MSGPNRRILLRTRPTGRPDASTWQLDQPAVPTPGESEFLVRLSFVSVDPAMRAWISGQRTYRPPVQPGELMPAAGVGRVVASRHPKFLVGETVTGAFGVQEYALSTGAGVVRVDARRAPPEEYLGLLGTAGLTAHIGLFTIGRVRPGDTVVVSGAAGAVGSVVGQLARIAGARAVGIAGGEAKCRYVARELGFDACVDRRGPALDAALRAACPAGIDVLFDNVGGAVLEAGLDNIARGARVVLCGAISQYDDERMRGPANYMQLLVQRASMTGFLVFDHIEEFGRIVTELLRRRDEGTLRADTYVIDGIENFSTAFDGLFDGANRGKTVLRVATSGTELTAPERTST